MMNSKQAYALSKKYTADTAEEFGAVKGASCQIKSIQKANNRNTVTFLWVNSKGAKQESVMIVEDGTPIYEWNSGDSYDYGDLCIYASNFYRCITPNSDVEFDDTKWNEIGSPDGNYDIVQRSDLLPPIFTAADRKMYYSISDGAFWLWNGYSWIKQQDDTPTANSKLPVTSSGIYSAIHDAVSSEASARQVIEAQLAAAISAVADDVSTQSTAIGTINRQLSSLIDDVGNNTSAISTINHQLSAIIDDVGTNTSAISAINTQLSAIIDDVGTNTSAISTINRQLSAVVDDVSTNTSAISAINTALGNLGTAATKDSTNEVTSGSTDLVESGAVKSAIDSAVASAYHHAGTKTVEELTSSLLIAANDGNVYNMTNAGTTTADFIEGAGKAINIGDNVGVAKVGENSYKFDLLSGFVDTSGFALRSEMSITDGSGADADKTTIQLKSGTSATVLKSHQDISGKANDSAVVHNTGNETIGGQKTFTHSIEVQAPSGSTALSLKGSSSEQQAWIHFKKGTDSGTLGYIGVTSDKKPYFYDTQNRRIALLEEVDAKIDAAITQVLNASY